MILYKYHQGTATQMIGRQTKESFSGFTTRVHNAITFLLIASVLLFLQVFLGIPLLKLKLDPFFGSVVLYWSASCISGLIIAALNIGRRPESVSFRTKIHPVERETEFVFGTDSSPVRLWVTRLVLTAVIFSYLLTRFQIGTDLTIFVILGIIVFVIAMVELRTGKTSIVVNEDRIRTAGLGRHHSIPWNEIRMLRLQKEFGLAGEVRRASVLVQTDKPEPISAISLDIDSGNLAALQAFEAWLNDHLELTWPKPT